MPWTVSHPALVLPLHRFSPRPLDFTALVLGSLTPDLGYYVNNFKLATFAHTLPGSFLACIPAGVLLIIVFFLFCRPLCYVLPSPHRQALLTLCPDFPTAAGRWAVIFASLLLGAWSHNFWDAFTHERGWFVDRIPWLMTPVTQLGSLNVRVYLVLQELSTVLGFAIVVITYWAWLRRQPAPRPEPAQSEAWRYLFWIAIASASLFIGYQAAAAYANSVSAEGVFFLRSITFRTAVYAPQIAVPLSLVAAAIIYTQRKSSPARPTVL